MQHEGIEEGLQWWSAAKLDSESDFILSGALQRDPIDRRRCIVGPGGQEAQTIIRVKAAEGEFVLLEVQPITGRTHQIRAHLAASGYAIVGDSMYSSPVEENTPASVMIRQFLHAYRLEFRRYPDNQVCTFVAPLADDLVAWLEEYFPRGLEAIHDSKTISA
jgi:23S rRNA-/tRNA-specific pseudouridylate synthase